MAYSEETAENAGNIEKQPGGHKSQGEAELVRYFLEKSRFGGIALHEPVQLPSELELRRLHIAAFMAGDVE